LRRADKNEPECQRRKYSLIPDIIAVTAVAFIGCCYRFKRLSVNEETVMLPNNIA
tara:strand:+ start:106910 stop:107074 length:165 start_codon:yes stop_codon:yes gene_type:complete